MKINRMQAAWLLDGVALIAGVARWNGPFGCDRLPCAVPAGPGAAGRVSGADRAAQVDRACTSLSRRWCWSATTHNAWRRSLAIY